MSERDAMLARIREALRRPAQPPGSHGHGHPPAPRLAEEPFSRWLPAVGAAFDDWVEAFVRASEELRTTFLRLADQAQAFDRLRELSRSAGWEGIATHRGELTDAARDALGLPALIMAPGYDANDLERCDAGISECDLLVAQTGSVVVTARNAGGRALSVLPPHHVVLARKSQLVPDLPTAFERLKGAYGPGFPSMISFITGPSRTGDIERILVLGAHGPKQLTVLMW